MKLKSLGSLIQIHRYTEIARGNLGKVYSNGKHTVNLVIPLRIKLCDYGQWSYKSQFYGSTTFGNTGKLNYFMYADKPFLTYFGIAIPQEIFWKMIL